MPNIVKRLKNFFVQRDKEKRDENETKDLLIREEQQGEQSKRTFMPESRRQELMWVVWHDLVELKSDIEESKYNAVIFIPTGGAFLVGGILTNNIPLAVIGIVPLIPGLAGAWEYITGRKEVKEIEEKLRKIEKELGMR